LDLLKAAADDFSATASALQAQLGRLDALIHAAAMLGSLGPIEHQSFDRWLEVWRVNVAAAMGITRAVLPLLDRATDASVVFTLDARGIEPRAYWGAYAASKAALHALVTTLADEWEARERLRVNAVVPGPIHSPLRRLTHPGEDKAALPAPERLLPLYLHLVRGQTKAESNALIDAQAWLAGAPAVTTLLPSRLGGNSSGGATA
jgi:NAD(P)-dependent dehydrogenase (short-subunit alcohol dehydrogenase family)